MPRQSTRGACTPSGRHTHRLFLSRVSTFWSKYLNLKKRHSYQKRVLIFINVLSIIGVALFLQPACQDCTAEEMGLFPNTQLCGPCDWEEVLMWKCICLTIITAHVINLLGTFTLSIFSIAWCTVFLILFNISAPLLAWNLSIYGLSVYAFYGSVPVNTFMVPIIVYQILVDMLVFWYMYDLNCMVKTYFPRRLISLKSNDVDVEQDALAVPVVSRRKSTIPRTTRVQYNRGGLHGPAVVIVEEADEVHSEPQCEPSTSAVIQN